MSYLVPLVGFMVVALILLVIALRRLGSKRDKKLDLALLTAGRSAADVYLPMKRLLSSQDRDFVDRTCDRPAGLQRRLQAGRKRVFRKYLREIYRDFGKMWSVARALAPMSRNAQFASQLTQQALTFHALYWTIQARCALGWTAPVDVNVGDLIDALERLQTGAQQVLSAQQPTAQAAIAAR